MTDFSGFNGKSILVTGGTGSFGKKFITMCLQNANPARLVIYSRDEMKQWEMQNELIDYVEKLRFFIGDVRDKERLSRAVTDIDIVIHAAAMKIVSSCEYNPFDCVKTNIIGAMNVVDVCIDQGVEKVVALSTDKASSPINIYGASKLASDKLFISGNNYSGKSGTLFSVVRYGNVMGSRGSVIPHFLAMRSSDHLPITDPSMTRFMITLEMGIELVCEALADMQGGEIYVKKCPSMKVVDIATAINPEVEHKIIGIRPGEKLHEQMIGVEESDYTFEYPGHYKVFPSYFHGDKHSVRIGTGIPVGRGFSYASDANTNWMSISDLRTWIATEYT